MRFLKITNRGTVHRKLLELLGFTTKRDKLKDLSIIGSKGSGTKLCIPALLRLGMKIWFCSSDEQGPYTLGYKVKKMPVGEGQEVNQIFFSYGEEDQEQIPMQFVLESFADWDKPIGADTMPEFKIVRELISNAQDADPGFGLEIVFEDGDGYTRKESGETSVFLSFTPGVEEIIIAHPERYIKFLSNDKPLLSSEGKGEMYPKSSGDTRVFLQGILVDCISVGDVTSLFDYSLAHKSLLSEERTVKNHSDLYRKLGQLIYSIEDLEFVKQLIENIPKGLAKLESRAMSQVSEMPILAKERFAAAWTDLYGENAVLASDYAVVNESAKLSGYEVITLNSHQLKYILELAGVKLADKVISEDLAKFSEIVLTPKEQAVFDPAYELFIYFYPEAELLPIRFFKSHNEKMHLYGFAGAGDMVFNEIWIADLAIARGAQVVLETLVHEWRHCASRAQDYTAEFVDKADRDQAQLLLRFGPKEIVNKIK